MSSKDKFGEVLRTCLEVLSVVLEMAGLHDVGKHADEFLAYLKATVLLEPTPTLLTVQQVRGQKGQDKVKYSLKKLVVMSSISIFRHLLYYSEPLFYLFLLYLFIWVFFTSVFQLLKSLFGTNLASQWEIGANCNDNSRPGNKPQTTRLTSNVRRPGLYHCCFTTPYTQFTQCLATATFRTAAPGAGGAGAYNDQEESSR